MTVRPCPACGGSARSLVYLAELEPIVDVTPIDGYRVVACGACGAVFADHIPEQGELTAYYATASKYTDVSPTDQQRCQQAARRFMMTAVSQRDAVCDVGSGAGAFAGALRTCGYRDVQERDVPAGPITITPESVDAITLIGVLEHVRDVEAFLRDMRNALRRDGLLYVEVPDLEHFDAQHSAPFQEFSSEHVNFWTRYSLDYALRRAGFWRVRCDFTVDPITPTTTSPTLCMAAVKSQGLPAFLAAHQYSGESARRMVVYAEAARAVPLGAVVWGCGTLTRRLWPELASRGLRAFTDRNTAYHGATLGGVPILPPADAVALGVPIVVITAGDDDDVIAQARALGAGDVRGLFT